jgi:hypothetical protein
MSANVLGKQTASIFMVLLSDIGTPHPRLHDVRTQKSTILYFSLTSVNLIVCLRTTVMLNSALILSTCNGEELDTGQVLHCVS